MAKVKMPQTPGTELEELVVVESLNMLVTPA
jgi:hypothetical protein